VAATAVGGVIGFVLSRAVPPVFAAAGPVIPMWLVGPFVALLGCIALVPFISSRFWHTHYPDFSFLLGSLVTAYYLSAFSTAPGNGMSYGAEKMLHAGEEFYAFIALVGGLYVVSGGILVDVRGRGRPLLNTLLLAVGAVISNVVGTTGASMLLIRPFMRLNQGRLTPMHIVFFIFIVSNCGGSLTPIGDPPLYLGYLKGVPFVWTIEHLWLDWVFVVGALLGVFFVADTWFARTSGTVAEPMGGRGVSVRGRAGLVCLVLMLVGVFIPVMLKGSIGAPLAMFTGATFQIAVAIGSYVLAPRDILATNSFNFGPVKEVGLLFAGIFATMVPALGYLAKHGAEIGVDTPTAFYFGTGVLSGVLDNAPTYLSFLQIAFGDIEVNRTTIAEFLSEPQGIITLDAISTGAVFFGAMTYIGNGPNFMVKSMAEAAGAKMPGFFGYLLRAVLVLLPILILHWLLFIR
jgi:Na+/H+ antiporter NhaD/arsenite permease-like protein